MDSNCITLTLEIVLDPDALKANNVTAEAVLEGLTVRTDDTVDGLNITANIPGHDCTTDYFISSGKITDRAIQPAWTKNDGLDRWRRLIIDKIEVYDACDLSDEERDSLSFNAAAIDFLARKLEENMQSGKWNEYEALELVFDRHFEEVVANCHF